MTKVLGAEARGFIFGGALAYKLGAGFVPARKPGKLPAATTKYTYELEYGTGSLEVHTDLQAGRYLAIGLSGQNAPYDFTIQRTPEDFNPAALRRSGKR